MSASLLARIPASVADIVRLPAPDRLAAIQFLLDWGAPREALVCLSELSLGEGEEWHLLAADALRRGGRAAEGVDLLDRLLARVDLLEARLLRVRCLMAAGHARDALDAAEALAQEHSNRAEAWLLAGDMHLALGRADDAQIAYVQAQRLDPASAAPAVGLLAAAHLARELRALRDAADAVQAHPGGLAGLRTDELQALRSGLIALGDLEQAGAISREMIARYDADLVRVQARLDSQRMAHGQAAAPSAPPAPPPSGVDVSPQELAAIRAGAHRLFGYGALLPLQADIITAARRGEDVLAVLPTGGGKSLCYQLPAFLEGGLTLVVSPLVALMKDQVDRLPARLRPAAVAVTGGLEYSALKDVLEGISASRYRLVYVAPERLRQRSFVERVRRSGITRLVVDEAHCLSVWGHDFRPDYLHLPQAHADLGAPPILALTATAPPAVREEIVQQLFAARAGRPLRIVEGDASRPNLWLGAISVENEHEKRRRVVDLCRTLPGSGIVYVRARGQADELAAQLREAGIAAASYHAGREDRPHVQDRFMRNEVRVVVATVAFGMGVDKADIRFVVHAGLPSSLEAYAQEVGRAGRDRLPAICALYYHARDLDSLESLAAREQVDRPLVDHLLDALAGAVGVSSGGVTRTERLAADLGADAQAVRVTLSLLEEAGLLERHYDAPRSVKLYLREPSRGIVFQRFMQAAHLKPGEPAEWPFTELAAAARIPVEDLEPRLLEWQEKGYLRCYPSGREMMVTLRAARRDAAARVDRLLEQRAASRVARARAVKGFIGARECRHVYLNRALGGQKSAPCGNCDGCGVALTDVFRAG